MKHTSFSVMSMTATKETCPRPPGRLVTSCNPKPNDSWILCFYYKHDYNIHFQNHFYIMISGSLLRSVQMIYWPPNLSEKNQFLTRSANQIIHLWQQTNAQRTWRAVSAIRCFSALIRACLASAGSTLLEDCHPVRITEICAMIKHLWIDTQSYCGC